MKTIYLFRFRTVLVISVLFLMFFQTLFAQETKPPMVPDTTKMTYNQISQGMKLYVYPSKGQSKGVQKADEYACYQWAIEQSGIDPLNLPKTAAPVAQTGPTGAAIPGAAKGAAAGAAIGAISGNTGEGAAIGAIVGGAAGRRQGKQAQAKGNEQAKSQATAQDKATIDSFTKAFSVCMEGKGYTIK